MTPEISRALLEAGLNKPADFNPIHATRILMELEAGNPVAVDAEPLVAAGIVTRLYDEFPALAAWHKQFGGELLAKADALASPADLSAEDRQAFFLGRFSVSGSDADFEPLKDLAQTLGVEKPETPAVSPAAEAQDSASSAAAAPLSVAEDVTAEVALPEPVSVEPAAAAEPSPVEPTPTTEAAAVAAEPPQIEVSSAQPPAGDFRGALSMLADLLRGRPIVVDVRPVPGAEPGRYWISLPKD